MSWRRSCRRQSCPGAAALQEIDQATLGAAVAFDIDLRLVDRAMAGKLLHITQAAARFEHQPRSIGDEGAAPRMGAAAFEAEIGVETAEPVDDAAGPQPVA